MNDHATLERATATIQRLCDHAGMDFRSDGFSLMEVVTLFQRCEYECDPDMLLRLVARGRIQHDGQEHWDALQMAQAVSFLEASRRWKAGSAIHQAKKSAALLAVEQHGDSHLREDVAERPLAELLILMAEQSNLGLREVFHECIKAKLRTLNVDLMD